ncbi:MAG TPA: hypothetical protein VGD40_24365 [Chryseosolibacter sp.]
MLENQIRDFITIDTSRFPIVLVTYQGFVPTWDEYHRAHTAIEMLVANRNNFVIILDFSQIQTGLSSEYRVAAARWASKTEPLFIKQNVKVAFYTPSVLTRIVMKGSLVLAPLRYPYTLAPTLEKAYAWAAKQLQQSQRPEGI